MREKDVQTCINELFRNYEIKTKFLKEVSFSIKGAVAYKKILRSANKSPIIDLAGYLDSQSRWPCVLRRSSIAGIAGSNPVDCMNVSLLCLLCVV